MMFTELSVVHLLISVSVALTWKVSLTSISTMLTSVTLCCQIIYLSRFHLVHYLDDTHRVTEVSIVEMEVRLTFHHTASRSSRFHRNHHQMVFQESERCV